VMHTVTGSTHCPATDWSDFSVVLDIFPACQVLCFYVVWVSSALTGEGMLLLRLGCRLGD
jgi:hypothetical protein